MTYTISGVDTSESQPALQWIDGLIKGISATEKVKDNGNEVKYTSNTGFTW